MTVLDINDFMADWVLSGRLVSIIIALTIVEGAALLLFHRVTRRGLRSQDYLLNLLSGLCLMLALRSALVGAAWPWVVGYLSASGLAHLADLIARCKRPGSKFKQPF